MKSTLVDVLGAELEDFGDVLARHDEVKRLLERIGTLRGKERQVLELRLGLEGNPRHTQREIAKRLGISRSYVSRIEKRATEGIRRHYFSLNAER